MSEISLRHAGKFSLLILALCTVAARADTSGLKDPTIPLLRSAVSASQDGFSVAELGQELLGLFSTYSLKSILIREDERIAVINDERVRVGDEIGRVRVAAIESGSVVLEGDGNVRVLTLHEQTIKTPIQVSK